VVVDPSRREWLERLIACCDRVSAATAPDPGDPYLRPLLADVEAFRRRLIAERDEDDPFLGTPS